MESKKSVYLKAFVSVVVAILVFGAFAYILLKEDVSVGGAQNILYFAIVGLCFVFSVLFMRFTAKKIFISLALACHVVADYFLILNPAFKNGQLIGLCVFCGAQFFYFLFTLSLCKGTGFKIFNISLRVALCLMAYFIIPKYFVLGTLETIAVMYFINSVVTLFFLLFNLKTQWLLFLGLLLFVACDIFVGLTHGGIEIFQITGKFLEILQNYNLSFYFYVPSLYLIALSSVWAKASRKKN